MSNATEMAIANIAKAKIITEDETPITYEFTTASEGTYTPVTSDGEENILRIKNEIRAINKTETIQYGTQIVLKDSVFSPEILAVIDGGTLTKDDTNGATKYSAPTVGGVVTRTKFTLELTTEEKDNSGATVKYAVFSFPHCVGTPASFSFKDNDWIAPEYTIESRPAKGESPYTVDFTTTLS